MSDADVASAPVTPAKATKKAPKEKKAKKPAPTHPKYSAMISEAIGTLKERSGSSRYAIVKYIVANFKIDEKTANTQVKLALKREVQSGSLKQVKGIGASGSFRLAKGDAESKPKSKKAAVKKAKKAVTPAPKKAEKKTPKKKKVVKKASSAAKKSPTKKPKAKKSPAKKPSAKKTAKPKKPAAKKAKK